MRGWKSWTRRLLGMCATVLLAVALLYAVDRALWFAKWRADVADCGTLTDSYGVVFALAIAGFFASALGRALRLPAIWNIAGIPIALCCFLFSYGFRHGLLTVSWMPLRFLAFEVFGRESLCSYAVLLGPAFVASSCAAISLDARNDKRMTVFAGAGLAVACAAAIAIFLGLSYMGTKAEVRSSSEWAQRLHKAAQHPRQQAVAHRRPPLGPPPSAVPAPTGKP